MFVKIFAVLYELRLKRLRASSEKIHKAYETAFREYYALSDACVRIRNEQSKMPKAALDENEKNRIGAAGDRRSKALLEMNKRELPVAAVDRSVSRLEARVARFAAKTAIAPSRERVAATGPAAILRLQ